MYIRCPIPTQFRIHRTSREARAPALVGTRERRPKDERIRRVVQLPPSAFPTISVITHATVTRKQVRQNEKRGQRARRCRENVAREKRKKEKETERGRETDEEGRKTR